MRRAVVGRRGLPLALLLLVLPLGLPQARAQQPGLSLLPATTRVLRASTIDIDVLATNGAATEAYFPLLEKVQAKLSIDSQSWPITLRRDADEAMRSLIPAGGFVLVRYHAALPSEALGRAVLELQEPDGGELRTVVDVIENGDGEATQPGAWNNDFLHQRAITGRLSIHQPIYFIAGGVPPAKFQVSFKYRLFGFGQEAGDAVPPHTVQLGYTQRSLWDKGPFYDTSYMPELMYQWLVNRRPDEEGGVTWLGLQGGYLHESNGRSGSDERSANTIYVRPIFSIGSPDDWHAVFQPEVWEYVFGLHTNPNLWVYRGNSSLTVAVAKGGGVSLSLTYLPGEHFSYGSRELDLSIPVNIPYLFDFRTYVLVQYFDGYAESLITYQNHTSAVRAGIQFVR
jgi:hypothetical protein